MTIKSKEGVLLKWFKDEIDKDSNVQYNDILMSIREITRAVLWR